MPFPEISDRINGIGFPRSPQFIIRSGEIRIFLNSTFYHFQTVMGLNDLFGHFMRREGCWYEDHFLKAERLPDLLRSPQVTQMDGIEGPPKQSNPSFFSLLLNL